MAASLFIGSKFSARDANGAPLALGKVYTYAAGTLTPQATYTNQGGGTPNANPVILDSSGRASIWLDPALAYRFITKDASDVTMPDGDVDNISTAISQVTLSTSSGASLIGWIQSGTGAVQRTVQDKERESVSVLDFIPVSEHAAIRARTSTLDVSSYINAALAAYPMVKVPTGQYRLLFPINLSARRNALSFWGRRLIGEGVNNTIFDSYTGVYPCIDATGQNSGAISGINFRSDNPPAGLSASDCASIGLQMGRGNVSQSCNSLNLTDVRFNLTSDMTRNGANGTVGICNESAEHIIADRVEVYANLPLVSHNVLQFAVSRSSNIPTIGVNYEQPYVGSPVSCTIHEWRNMVLVAYDSFRIFWFNQVAGVQMPNLYTSTHKLVSSLPAQKESFFITTCSNITLDAYQEASGLFGATYRMDHRYLTYSGDNENINLRVQRGVGDYGFTIPGAAEPSIQCLNAGYLANSDINCNYTIGIYNASVDNNGFAALPVAFTGTPNGIKNVKFTLDHSGSHSADIFSSIGVYCTNVDSINYYSGDNYWGAQLGTFTPVIAGASTAGAGTYTAQIGKYSKSGRTVHVQIQIQWTAHTGTGAMTITGLPFTANAFSPQSLSVDYDSLTVGAGKQLSAVISQSSTTIFLHASDPAGGAQGNVAIDTVVPSLTISGTYWIA